MAIIRREQIGMAREGVTLNLGDLARQGEQIRELARAEAASIIRSAREERERLVSTAYEEGMQAGLKKGVAQGIEQGRKEGHAAALAERKAALAMIESAWSEALAGFVSTREDDLAAAREDVVRLAVYLAERIVRRSIAADPSAVTRQVEAVLALVARPSRLVISINPADEAVVREALPGLTARFPMAAHVELITDAGLSVGGCTVRTAAGGWFDASVETQLDRIAGALLSLDVSAGDAAGEAAA